MRIHSEKRSLGENPEERKPRQKKEQEVGSFLGHRKVRLQRCWMEQPDRAEESRSCILEGFL